MRFYARQSPLDILCMCLCHPELQDPIHLEALAFTALILVGSNATKQELTAKPLFICHANVLFYVVIFCVD